MAAWLPTFSRLLGFLVVFAGSLTYAFHRPHPWRIKRGSRVHMECSNSAMMTPYTSALLHVSYDGSRFNGWSAGDRAITNESDLNNGLPNANGTAMHRSGRKRRRRGDLPPGSGFVRSVEGVLRTNLAKLYGNVDPSRIIVDGCSRTDKGVHARGMIAQVYCLTEEAAVRASVESRCSTSDTDKWELAIPGKRKPHPWNSTDSSMFEPIPFPLSKVAFALNRMCFDLRIIAIAPSPTAMNQVGGETLSSIPFHPSMFAKYKTYHYQFSVGPIHDPLSWRSVWHLGNRNIDLDRLLQACVCLEGRHDFAAFQGAPRGVSDKRKRERQTTVCHVQSISTELISTWQETKTYRLAITGDRFLYKMVRFLVGAIAEVGSGALQVEDLRAALQSGVRPANLFECAPAKGLVLENVYYEEAIDWISATG